MLWEKERCLSEEKISGGVAKGWDHLYINNKDYCSPSKQCKHVKAATRDDSKVSQNIGETCHLPQNTQPSSFPMTSMCQSVYRCVNQKHLHMCKDHLLVNQKHCERLTSKQNKTNWNFNKYKRKNWELEINKTDLWKRLNRFHRAIIL